MKNRHIPPEKKRTPTGQKPREAPPPGKFLRTVGGMPGELRRTKHTTSEGRWLYKIWFGDVTGATLWTIDRLLEEGVTFLQEHPVDLRPRKEKDEAESDPGGDSQEAGNDQATS